MVALDAIGLAVEGDRVVQLASGLVDVRQRDGMGRVLRLRRHQPLVAGDGLVALAHAVAGGGVQGANRAVVVRLFREQSFGLLVGLGELLHPQQDVAVLDAGGAMIRLELHAALQQEFRVVQRPVAGGDLGQ